MYLRIFAAIYNCLSFLCRLKIHHDRVDRVAERVFVLELGVVMNTNQVGSNSGTFFNNFFQVAKHLISLYISMHFKGLSL
jgi:hypothetical protein